MLKVITRHVAVLMIITSPPAANAQNVRDLSVAEAAQQAMEASLEARQALQVAVPRGAVMAFNLSACPDGWSDFAELDGRMILGAGPAEDGSVRIVADRGGTEAHTLTIDEMPMHNHSNETFDRLLQMNRRTVGAGSDSTGAGVEPDVYAAGEILSAGGGLPHNNMPPYFTLKFCVRR